MNWESVGIALAVAMGCFVLLYRSEIFRLVDRWNSDPGWSHGFVVPIISGFFVWIKWDSLRALKPQGTWSGLLLVGLGVVGQILFRATGTVHMSTLSILVLMYGMVLFLFGWQHMKLLWLPISFLLFALPPPDSVYVALTTPMQTLAAELGVRLLPLFGAMGFREGTTIQVQGGARVGAAGCCAGVQWDADAGGVFRAGGGVGLLDVAAHVAKGIFGGVRPSDRDLVQLVAGDGDGGDGRKAGAGVGEGQHA